MLIQSSPFSVPTDVIPLSAGVRGALGLGEGAEVFMMLIPRAEWGGVDSRELLVTPIRPALWADLWILHLELQDVRGGLRRLTELLSSKKIGIAALETSALDAGRFHRVNLLCDCRSYESTSHDSNTASRFSREKVELTELTAAIAVEFISELCFAKTGEPRIFLSRSECHHRAAQLVRQSRRVYQARCNERGILWDQEIAEHLSPPCEGRLTVDTHERMARVLLSRRHVLVDVEAELSRDVAPAAVHLFAELESNGFDVVRSELGGVSGDARTRLRLLLRLPERLQEGERELLGHVLHRISSRCEGVHLREPNP